MAKIKIAYILTPVDFGGLEKVSLNFLKNIDRRRFAVHPVVMVRPWEDEKRNPFIREVRKEGYMPHSVPVALRSKKQGASDYLRVLRCGRLIYSFLKEGGFDIVHTNGYFADTVGIPAARLLGIPAVSTCHGFIESGMKLRLYNALDCIMLRMAGKTIAVSESIRDALVKKGLKSSRIEVITNAVNPSVPDRVLRERRVEKRLALGIKDDEFVIGYCGRLSREKGLEFLLRAVSTLGDAGRHVRLVLIGDGPERQSLEKLSMEPGLSGRVIFTGFLRDAEEAISALDLFVLPSLTEGTPMALLEAMAVGVPVVASAVGGIPSVVQDGRDGLLVSPGRIEELTGAVEKVMKDDVLRKKLSKKGRERIREKYDIKAWTRKMENEYLGLCGRGNNSGTKAREA